MGMDLICVRHGFGPKATEGTLFSNGKVLCYTLEDLPGDYGKGFAIPPGRYAIIITRSQRFKRKLPLICNVPGRDGIRLHSGNDSDDTEGCVLVGRKPTTPTDNYVGESKLAFDELYLLIDDAERRGIPVWWHVLELR